MDTIARIISRLRSPRRDDWMYVDLTDGQIIGLLALLALGLIAVLLFGCASEPPAPLHNVDGRPATDADRRKFEAAKVECNGEMMASLAGTSTPGFGERQRVIDGILLGCMARKGYVK